MTAGHLRRRLRKKSLLSSLSKNIWCTGKNCEIDKCIFIRLHQVTLLFFQRHLHFQTSSNNKFLQESFNQQDLNQITPQDIHKNTGSPLQPSKQIVSKSIIILQGDRPQTLASSHRKSVFLESSNTSINQETDTSALYVSHTSRQRPQTPAASRAATISHTAETL